MKRLIFSAAIVTIGSILLNSNNHLYSDPNGAPAARTGAPRSTSGNETTCAASGCHGTSLNNGPHTAGISITGNPTGYDAGSTYTITAKINNPTGTAGGFQMVCLNPTKASAGTFTAGTNNKRISAGGRFYMTHTARTSRTWSFTWQAPSPAPDSVTFYLATMETVGGVYHTYTTSLVFRKNVVTDVADVVEETEGVLVFPTVASDRISIRNPHFGQLAGRVQIVGMDGRLVQDVHLSAGTDLTEVELPREMKSGIYNLRILTSKGIETRRIQKI